MSSVDGGGGILAAGFRILGKEDFGTLLQAKVGTLDAALCVSDAWAFGWRIGDWEIAYRLLFFHDNFLVSMFCLHDPSPLQRGDLL